MLSVLGSIASNLGVNIQKFSFIRQSRRMPNQRATSHWKDLYWLSGLGLVILGSLGDFAALSMVAQSIGQRHAEQRNRNGPQQRTNRLRSCTCVRLLWLGCSRPAC